MLPVIKKLERHNVTTRSFAKILKNQSDTETIGYIQRDTAKSLRIKTKSRILINKNYLLHMDNSGHFTGDGFGRNGHSDKKPLSIMQIGSIARIIKTAKDFEIMHLDDKRNMKRVSITRGELVVIIEYRLNNNEVYLVTAYNKQNSR